MCDLTDKYEPIYCEKKELKWKLNYLLSDEVLTLKNGEVVIRIKQIEKLIKELDCSI